LTVLNRRCVIAKEPCRCRFNQLSLLFSCHYVRSPTHRQYAVQRFIVQWHESFAQLITCKLLRRGGREAEGGGLLNRYTGYNLYRGFESLPLRHYFGYLAVRSR